MKWLILVVVINQSLIVLAALVSHSVSLATDLDHDWVTPDTLMHGCAVLKPAAGRTLCIAAVTICSIGLCIEGLSGNT